MKYLGQYFSDKSIECYEINGKNYALYGWNGEDYGHSFEVDNYLLPIDGKPEVTVKPIERWKKENLDLSEIEENSEEWDEVMTIVDYEVD